MKLNIPPFEGRYSPDAYLTWELEVEQHFSCLRYPEHLRISAATGEFTKESSKVEFLASEVSDPEILCDLHLYLVVELFLCACCRRALTCWCSRLTSLVRSSLGPTQHRC
jgi:hypothetical protein